VLRALALHSLGVMSSNHELLKGREGAVNHAGQSTFNVNLELCNFRELLRRLKGEVDVGLERLDVVIKNMEIIGPGQGCRDSVVKKVVKPKGKEKMGVEGWGPKPTRGFKPKRKMVFKPKVVVGLGARPKGVKPSFSLQMHTVGESSVAVALSSVRLAGVSLRLASGNEKWAREEFTGSWTGVLGHLRSASKGVIPDGLGLSVVGGCLGCPKAAEVSSVMLGEEVRATSGGLGLIVELDLVKAQREHGQELSLNWFKCIRGRRSRPWVTSLGEDFGTSFSGFRGEMPPGPKLGEATLEVSMLESPALISTGIVRSCSWSEGRWSGSLTSGLLGEAPSVLPSSRGEIVSASPAMGVSEMTGILGVYVDSAGEKFCDEASLGVAVLADFVREAQGIGPKILALGEVLPTAKEDLPTAKELKLVFEVSGIAGLFCDGQEGKLADALGQIVAKKHGKGGKGSREISNLSSSVGYVGGSNQRVRAIRILNEA
jgi:hypothetical protein